MTATSGSFGAEPIAEDELLTGEAVALDIRPSSVVLQILGGLIDLVISIVLLVLGGIGLAALGRGALLSEGMSRIAGIVLAVLVLVILPTVVETLTGGRSVGRYATGARIVRVDGGAIGLRHAFIRAVAGVLEIYLTLGSVACLAAMFSPRSQRLGDMMAGTVSVQWRMPDPQRVPPMLPPGLEAWAPVADASRLPPALERRAAVFVSSADKMDPYARAHHAAELAAQLAPFVHPVPSGEPERVVRAVVAMRYARERARLLAQDAPEPRPF